MIYISNVPVTMEINTVQDLSKLGAFTTVDCRYL